MRERDMEIEIERDAYGNPGDNRHCGFPTKSGRPCRAHAVMGDSGGSYGCYLHDPRRRARDLRWSKQTK
jgi:hypothetical protein